MEPGQRHPPDEERGEPRPARHRGGRDARGSPPRALARFLPLIVFLVAAAVYLNALPGPFVYDDIGEIRDNPRVHDLSNVPSLLTTDFWGGGEGHNPLYRPLTAVVTTVLHVAGGGRPMPFHALNLLLHAAASALAMLLLVGITGSRAASFAGALLFAVHPVHTEAIAWISGTAEVLSGLMVIAAWLAHLRGRTLLAAILLALGMLSKEGAVVFPALAAAGDALSGGAWRERLRSYAAYAGTVAAYLLLRLIVLGHLLGTGAAGSPLLNPLRGAPALERVLTSLSVTGRAIVQSVFPRRLCLDYGFDQIPVARGILDGGVLLGAALAVGLVAGALAWDRARRAGARLLTLGAAIFLVAFLPTSNLLFPGISIFAERNLYLPVLGFCLVAGLLLLDGPRSADTAVPRRGGPGGAAIAVAAILIVAGGARTFARNAEFLDPLDLYGSAVASCPRSARAHSFLGIALREAGRPEEAVAAHRAALRIAPDYSNAHAELGLALDLSGDKAEAERSLRQALRLNPLDREARGNLSALLAETGRMDDALRESRTLIETFPDDPQALNNHAGILLDLGDPASLQEARGIFVRLEREAPASPLGPNGLGALAAREGRMDLAVEAFEEALRRSPGDLNATYNLAMTLARLGRNARALDVVEGALAAGVRDDDLLRLRDALRAAPPR